ncbi:hypothetical protein [Pseudoalteromonas agarivorans]|uniref:Tyr recombinase domain-containing protein n=1 Tax=Pseudoalteromonas agarivorans TaxID=176102 RepID=A0AAD0U2I2_9GAMM|nr:hypothetical protein [Pseudoalteromonas agarivorans]AYM86865.1 hypothetical protein D9T18_09165 [Pseudoalteromonas agarivorans]
MNKANVVRVPDYIDIPLCEQSDSIDIQKLTPSELYKLNPVVTYEANGQPLNRFRDKQWNYKAYANQNTNRVEAKYIVGFKTLDISQNLSNELKAVVLHSFLNEYPKNNNARVGQIIYEQISKFFIDLNSRGKPSIAVLSKSLNLIETLTRIGPQYALGTMRKSLGGLAKIEKFEIPDIDLVLPIKSGYMLGADKERTIEGLAQKYCRFDSKIPKQTLYIPSNIHSKVINCAVEMLIEAESNIERITNFFVEHWHIHALSEDIEKGMRNHASLSKEKQAIRASGIRRVPSKANREAGIVTRSELLEKYQLKKIDDSYAASGKGIFYYTGIIAAACYIIIASFSGMREDEVMALKHDSYKTKGTKKRKIHFLRSYESKISGGSFVDYVTSPLSERAINILKKLHTPARELIPELKNDPFICITHSLLRLPTYGVTTLTSLLPNFMAHFNITTTAQDLKEHELFNPNSTKTINIGDVWPLSSHQFRRTLIVNFLTHSITGVTQLKQQVKHMYAFMTEYYGKNAELAIALKMSRSRQFMSQLNEERLDIGVVLYKRFYQSEEHLEGVKGKEIERQRGLAQQLTDDEIRLLIKTGAFKLTSTIFGYCTKGNLCDKGHIVDPTFCGARCETMIITIDNALQWEKLYKRNLSLLKSNTMVGFEGAETMMKSQNAVAIKIMKSFDIKYELIEANS